MKCLYSECSVLRLYRDHLAEMKFAKLDTIKSIQLIPWQAKFSLFRCHDGLV